MLDELGRVSAERDALTRTFLSPAMRRANARVARWMREAGLQVREDRVGNLIGRLESIHRDGAHLRTFVLGSHLDTVRNAGRFDGALGVLAPLLALQEVRRRGISLPFAVEVIGFSEEEGVRFSSAYLGSKAYAGKLRASDLRLRDAEGVSVEQALQQLGKGSFRLPRAAHQPRELLGYCEVHIEQGPVLEHENLGVGVVAAIAGQTRVRVVFRGHAGHAGTTPMPLRQDALAGAAEFVTHVENYAVRAQPLVATVGTIAVPGGAPNVIPGEVRLSLDVRHAKDAARVTAVRALRDAAAKIARSRRLSSEWEVTQDNSAVTCSTELTRTLARAVTAVQGRSLSLVSGAGHDAVIMGSIAPISMLFVRCKRGVSHHPSEYASPKDIGTAVEVLVRLLQQLASA